VALRGRTGGEAGATPAPPPVVDDPLDGWPETPDQAARRPLGVIIENFPSARPQWGLSLAERVYEALTEGGITRYLAIFRRRDVDRVGPVRSARTQFLDYALELDAPLAHVGGNEDALAGIGTFHVKDLDEFRFAGAYRRIFRPHLALEHTMFTSTRALRALAVQRWGEAARLPRGMWKADLPPAARAAEARVVIDFSFPEYRVAWVYRPRSNDYERLLAGAPDVDAATGEAVTAKAIVIAVVPRSHGRTRIGEDTWTFADVGSGRAWVVQDGRPVEGQWRKESRTSPLRLVDGSGREIAFDRGPRWVEIVPPEVTPVFEAEAALQ
jgi:hypothetical protein